MNKIGVVILELILLSLLSLYPFHSTGIANAQLASSESYIFYEDFESVGNSSLIGWTMSLQANLGDNLHSDYLYFFADSNLIINGRIIPSPGPYMPLNSSEYKKALDLFEKHVRITDEDKFSGSKSFLVDLSSFVDGFSIERDFGTSSSGGLIVLQFAIKLEGSRENIPTDAWSHIGGGGIFGPDGSPLWFEVLGRGTDRVVTLVGEKDGYATTILFELDLNQWYEIEMVVDTSSHSYSVRVNGLYGKNGPYTSSDLTSRGWNVDRFRLQIGRSGISQLKVYLDSVRVFTLSEQSSFTSSTTTSITTSLTTPEGEVYLLFLMLMALLILIMVFIIIRKLIIFI